MTITITLGWRTGKVCGKRLTAKYGESHSSMDRQDEPGLSLQQGEPGGTGQHVSEPYLLLACKDTDLAMNFAI